MQPGPGPDRRIHLLVIRRRPIGKSGETIPAEDIQIVQGLAEEHVEQGLRVTHQAFAQKFRIGFRNSDDMVRLFQDSVHRQNCITAAVDGRLSGILAFISGDRKFYNVNTLPLFTTFWPHRTALVLFTLTLLTLTLGETVKPDEFKVDTIAVDPASRGLGIGTVLMHKAEEIARSSGALKMSLDVLGDNTGAIRLYERLGYSITDGKTGFLVRLATKSQEVLRMEKPLGET